MARNVLTGLMPDVGAGTEGAPDKARRERRHALILPREHGAWGLLLVPMVTGAGVAFRDRTSFFPFVLLLTAALTLFWLRTPLESLLGTSALRAQTTEERDDVMFVVAYLGTVAALALAMLLRSGHDLLLWLGAAAGTAFVGQALLKLMWRRAPRQSRPGEAGPPSSRQSARMLSEIVGTIGLTAAGPAAYYVMTGKFGRIAWMLWLANFVFAGDQIHYVQLRIHTARVAGLRAKLACGWAFALGQFAMATVLVIACGRGLMPWLTLAAFAPILCRGWYYFFQKPAPLVVRHLGWSELTQAVVFCVLFITAFTLAR